MATTSKQCSICGVAKTLNKFGKKGNVCNVCRRRRSKDSHSESVKNFLGMKLTKAKSRKDRSFEVAVGIDYLMELWRLQRGMCALSGLPMAFDSNFTDRSVSIDRIDCSKGYIVDNIRLVCTATNIMRKDMLDSEFYWWCKAVAENMYED